MAILVVVVVYAAQPREGTETFHRGSMPYLEPTQGLCSSTPRGDGNNPFDDCPIENIRVYAAQPREGTETGD